MGKFSLIRLYNADEVPDEIFQQVCDAVNKLGEAVSVSLHGYDQSIVLSAFNRFHAAMIVALITEDGLEEAAKTEAIGLMKNIDRIANTNHFGAKEAND